MGYNFLNIITVPNVLLLMFFCLSGQIFADPAQVSVESIDNQIRILNSEITDISGRIRSIQSDSIRIVTDYNTKKMQFESSLSEIETSVALAQNSLQKFQSQYQNNKNDSINATTSYIQNHNSQQNNTAAIENSIATLTQQVKSLKTNLATLENISRMTTDEKITVLKRDSVKTDSLIEFHAAKITDYENRILKLKNDSTAQSSILISLVQQNRLKTAKHDSLYNQSVNSVNEISRQLSAARDKYNVQIIKLQDELKGLTATKIKLASLYTQQKIQYDKVKAERTQLGNSLKSLKTQYERERAPYVKQFRESDSLLNLRVRQKALWNTMSEKYVIDSTIMETRNELDKQIQLAAQGNRSAKKMIENVENDLHTQLGKQDEFMRRPGVKRAEAELRGQTLSQRKHSINKFLVSINKDLTRLTDLKRKNELLLAEFDRKQPAQSNPSMQKYKSLTTTCSTLEAQLNKSIHEKDSIDNLITTRQSAFDALKAESNKDVGAVESKLTVSAGEKNRLELQLKQTKAAFSNSEKLEYDKLQSISSQISTSVNGKALSERELILQKAHKIQLSKDINTAVISLSARKQKASQDIIALNTTIASNEAELANLAVKKTQLSGNEKTVYANYRAKITEFGTTNHIIADSISRLRTEIEHNKSRSSALTSALNESQTATANSLRTIKGQLEQLRRQLTDKRTAIMVLNKNKTDAIALAEQRSKQAAMTTQAYPPPQTQQQQPKPQPKPEQYYSAPRQSYAEQTRPISNQTASYSIPAQQPQRSSQNSGSVDVYDSLIRAKENEIALLRAARENMKGNGGNAIKNAAQTKQTVSASQPTKVSTPAVAPAQIAKAVTSVSTNEIEQTNTIIEQIYTYLGNENVHDAKRLFSNNKNLLKKHAAPEAIKMLEAAMSGL